MLNDTQIKFVKTKIHQNGKISRNECLKNYITRLGAIIYKLKQSGYSFRADYVKKDNGTKSDYVYYAIKIPKDSKCMKTA